MNASRPDILLLGADEFARVRSFLREAAGVELSESKRHVASSVLAPRLAIRGVRGFAEYLTLLARPSEGRERDWAVDLLTTHETSFFRERAHFETLRARALAWRGHRGAEAGAPQTVVRPVPGPPGTPERLLRTAPWSARERGAARGSGRFRVLCAATSTGEEAWSAAMVLAEVLRADDWEVLGTDIGTETIERARLARYPESRLQPVPPVQRTRWFRPDGPGKVRVVDSLRENVRFAVANLLRPPPFPGPFDVIFLRNVLIYFDRETRATVVGHLARVLRPGGHLLIGHSETLTQVRHALSPVEPSVYRRDDG